MTQFPNAGNTNRTKIYCIVSDKGVHSFYMLHDGCRYYLFQQDYRKSVQRYFRQGVSLRDAMNFKKTHNDGALRHTMEKLPSYIKYIEKEYGIAVSEKTKQKQRNLSRKYSPRMQREQMELRRSA